MIKWTLLSGPTRYYLWTYPEVLVADPEMIKQITIKYFDKFPDRQQGMGLGVTTVQGKLYNDLIQLKGQKWKQSRNIITPAFTGSKMKLVSVCMHMYICAYVHMCICVYCAHNMTGPHCNCSVWVSVWKMEPLMRKSTLKLVEKLKHVADTDQSVNALE